jgi:hypothetical protein
LKPILGNALKMKNLQPVNLINHIEKVGKTLKRK